MSLTAAQQEELAQAKMREIYQEQIRALEQQIINTNPILIETARQREHDEHLYEIAEGLARKTGFRAAARALIKEIPIYYDRNQLWWMWNKKTTAWEIVDETDIMTISIAALRLNGDQSVKSKGFMVEALRQEGRINKPKDFPKTWIQFNDRFFDIETSNTYQATPEYFCVNPIPWSIGQDENTPEISKLFDEWVGADYTQTLYEIIAYACFADYPIHIIVCLVGSGRNGKSKFLGLIQNFIGKKNISSTELEALFENRFETFKLYKKLVCLMGETNFNTLRNTSLLKRMTGQDLIGFEAKGKQPFDDINYAKIIISTNALPTSDDSSDGFYRRWMIIDFPKEFPEGIDVLARIPQAEYESLAKKVTKILPQLLQRGKFLTQGTIEERKKKYIETSNPLLIFTNQFCIKEETVQVKYSTLYTRYAHWLSESKRRVVSRKEFTQMLEREGHEIKDTTFKDENGQFEKGKFVLGIKMKEKITEYVYTPSTADTVDTTDIPITSFPYRTNREYNGNDGNDGTARLNDVSTGNEGENSPSFGKYSLLENIRSIGEVDHQLCQDFYPGEPVDQWITELLRDGELLQFKPGKYKVLS